jgi:hypothetical protein
MNTSHNESVEKTASSSRARDARNRQTQFRTIRASICRMTKNSTCLQGAEDNQYKLIPRYTGIRI